MLCVLFLGARMRALQMDPKHGNPQRWAQNCFYLCTYSGFFFFPTSTAGIAFRRVITDVHSRTTGQYPSRTTNIAWDH